MSGSSQVILFAVGHEIRQSTVHTKNFEVAVIGKRIQSLTVDVSRKLIYWTDSSLNTIMRAMIPENPRQLAHPQNLHVGGIVSPNGIAFDWVARLVSSSWRLFFNVVKELHYHY